jgi:hypothetical protein
MDDVTRTTDGKTTVVVTDEDLRSSVQKLISDFTGCKFLFGDCGNLTAKELMLMSRLREEVSRRYF